MSENSFVRLDRAVVALAGEDRKTFLQGLVSNDVTRVSPQDAVWAAMLTPQGKFLWDLFIVEAGDILYLDVEAPRAEAFAKKLSLYKLRSKVSVTLRPDLAVWAVLDGAAVPEGGICYSDPRLPVLGRRLYVSRDCGLPDGDFLAWDRLRLESGVPDGSRDLEVEKALLLENGFDELGGVDFNKGCYMGQELTARTKYRGLVRKRLLPVRFDGPVLAPGTPLLAGEAEAGEIRSGLDGLALAMVRLDYLGQDLTAQGRAIRVFVPDWVKLPEAG